MRWETPFDRHYRPRQTALMAAAATALATCTFVWLLLKPTNPQYQPLAAVIRARGLFGDAGQRQEQALAGLLSPENLALALRDEQVSSGEGPPAATLDRVREKLRVDLGKPDKIGAQTIVLRWTGARSSSAASLLNFLARRLVSNASQSDVAGLETAYAEARQAIEEASREIAQAREGLESAVAEATVARRSSPAPAPTPAPTPAPRPAPRSNEPTPAPHRPHQADEWQRLTQQLNDLEGRRQTLAERLMPEHPEMKAIDEKIEALRSTLNAQAAPPGEEDRAPPPLPPSPLPSPSPEPPWLTDTTPPTDEVARRTEDFRAALAGYDSAMQRERTCWQALCAARGKSVAEIEPAVVGTTPTTFGWQRRLAASLCGLLCGGLVLARWPVRRPTFSTVEELRAVTRLPVVVIPRGSLI